MKIPGHFSAQIYNEDFDFEGVMRDIHIELAGLNEEAAALAAQIQANFEGLGL